MNFRDLWNVKRALLNEYRALLNVKRAFFECM